MKRFVAIPRSKKQLTVWVQPETTEKVKELYKQADCRNHSEFVERAIRYYAGYVTAKDKANYLPNMFLSTMSNIVHENITKQNRMLFKLAVEMAMVENILANLNNFDPIAIERLRGACVEEVKEINGTLRFEDAVDWQDAWDE